MRHTALPPPVLPGHTAQTMLINSMRWGPPRPAPPPPPPPFVGNGPPPMMAPVDGGRGFGTDMAPGAPSANLIFVPTRRQDQRSEGQTFNSLLLYFNNLFIYLYLPMSMQLCFHRHLFVCLFVSRVTQKLLRQAQRSDGRTFNSYFGIFIIFILICSNCVTVHRRQYK